MISLFVVILELAHASKISLSKQTTNLIYIILIVLISFIILFDLEGIYNQFIVILDLFSALCILIFTISKSS